MAIYTATALPVMGVNEIEWAAASGSGDKFPAGRDVIFLVRNNGESGRDVTLTTPATVLGVATADVVRTVAAGDIAAIPLHPQVYRSAADGLVSVAYSAATDLEVAVLRLPR